MTVTNMDQARVLHARAVFTALFDTLEAVDAIGEQEWSDFIHIVNSTGRLMWGWTRLDSSESDVFAALDDIAVTLERAKEELAGAAKEMREVLDGPVETPAPSPAFEIHQELSGTAELGTAPEPPLAIPPPAVLPELTRDETSQLLRGAQDRLNQERVAAIAARDAGMFATIRANPAISYMELAKGTDVTDGAIRFHFATMAKKGQLPEDIDAWRLDRTSHTVGGKNHPRRPDKPPKAPKAAKPSKRAAQSAALAIALSPASAAAEPDPDPEPFFVEGSGEAARKLDALLSPVVVSPFPRPSGWSPDCKSPGDWTVWREANAQLSVLNRLDRPCDDCPLAYATEKLRQGRCNGIPVGGWPAVAQ